MKRTPDLVITIDDIISAPARLQAERDLRLAAEDEARQLRARVADLERYYNAAITFAPAKLIAAEERVRVAEARVAELEAQLTQWKDKTNFFYAAFEDEARREVTR